MSFLMSAAQIALPMLSSVLGGALSPKQPASPMPLPLPLPNPGAASSGIQF